MGIHREEPNVLSNTPSEAAIVSEFGNILSTGGTEVTIVPEIHRIKFTKNAWNCTLGPMCALSRFSMQDVFRKPADQDTPVVNGVPAEELTPAQKATTTIPSSFPEIAKYSMPWLYEVLEEVTQLGRKLFPDTDVPGIVPQLPLAVLNGTAVIVIKPTSNERPSMLVDVELGRPLETDVVVGEVVRAGRRAGVPMPVGHLFVNPSGRHI